MRSLSFFICKVGITQMLSELPKVSDIHSLSSLDKTTSVTSVPRRVLGTSKSAYSPPPPLHPACASLRLDSPIYWAEQLREV